MTRSRDPVSPSLARRALLAMSAASLAGSLLGVAAIVRGIAGGGETVLVLSCVVFGAGSLVTQLAFPKVPQQRVAAFATAYLLIYLLAGATIAAGEPAGHESVLVYLIWFFPLLVFDRIVNAALAGRILSRAIVAAPLIFLLLAAPHLARIFAAPTLFWFGAYALSFVGFAVMFGIVMRYREAYAAERERESSLEQLRAQAELLDKAQDAILVAGASGRIVYWNKGAERLYGWPAAEVLGRDAIDVIADGAPDVRSAVSSVLVDGEWTGELNCRRRDGTTLFVESRCTLVTSEDGAPRSILSIMTDITARKAAEAKIERLAFFDALTELPNRSLLRERLDKALAAAARLKTTGALLFIDLDDFKTLNDSLGHDIGDIFLQHVGRRLTSCVRTNDTVARLGGDEFVVMFEGLSADPRSAAAEVKVVADKLLHSLALPVQMGNYEYASSASIGVTLFSGQADTVDDLLKRADLAMYRAKARGRNTLCFFDPAMQAFVAARAARQSDLRRALGNGEFVLHYQPQVNGRVVFGAEALLRWRHPLDGFISPDEFIPLAEEAGLIVELGRYVIDTACAQLARWAGEPDLRDVTLSVNVSPRQLRDANFVELVCDALAASQANPLRLKLEITESSAMENVDDTIAKMTALRARDVGFSLDDFGTGYSSLAHLKRLPLDQLKIDRSFVTDVLCDPKDASIVHTLIALGRNLNLTVIAEGVESEGQRTFLERAGCANHQGFLYSPAVDAATFETFVRAMPERAAVAVGPGAGTAFNPANTWE